MRFVEQIPGAQTHEGGASNDAVGIHDISLPERLCHSTELLFHVVLRDLVEMGTDDDVRRPIKAVSNKLGKTLPVATGELFKGDDGYDSV